MKILVCDDEEFFRDLISEYCRKFEKEFHIPILLVDFEQGKDVISYLREKRDVGLFILDIMMKEVNGLQVAKEIRKKGSHEKIVFLTSALEYAPEGYNYQAKYYWMKPLSYQKFAKDLLEIYHEHLEEDNSYFIENIGTAIEKVYFSDVIYIETKGRKTFVHRKNDGYISTKRMMEYEELLDDRFYRCHAAYIVNMDYVIKVQGGQIELTSQENIYMSKGKKKNFLNALSEHLGKNIGLKEHC